MDMAHSVGCPRSRIAVWTTALVIAIYVAWIGAWMLKQSLDQHTAWAATEPGGFVYWTAMKVLLWIVPAVLLIRLSGRSFGDVLGLSQWRHAVLWGGGTALLLGLISLTTKAIQHKPLLSVSVGWPLFSAIVIAPVFEEFLFRGAVLGALTQRYRFATANVLTAVSFLAIHLPGWYFQGRLWQNLTSPSGGAAAILLLGLVFGLVAHKSRSLLASILAHGLNNLFSL
jgi:membrane protease YdiL (CAAX protease family)